MPNIKGGKGYKNRRKVESAPHNDPLPDLEDDQRFGYALKPLGNRMFKVMCHDKIERLCRIRGGMRRRTSDFVRIGDFVIISIRTCNSKTPMATKSSHAVGDYINIVLNVAAQPAKLTHDDIIMKLTDNQEKLLRKDSRYEYLASIRTGRTTDSVEDDGIEFDYTGATDELSSIDSDDETVTTKKPAPTLSKKSDSDSDSDLNIDNI